MIRIFSKLRKQLLAQNKISRYLSYAFGELALVVIGILIGSCLSDKGFNF